MSNEVRATTVDNPFNPFTEWDQWFFFDLSNGYHTCERLASISQVSDQLSDAENAAIAEDAINELIKTGAINKNGLIVEYKKVWKN